MILTPTSSRWNISLLSVTNIIILPSVHFASYVSPEHILSKLKNQEKVKTKPGLMFLFTISPPLGSQAPLKKSHLSAKLKSQWTPFCITESIANTANNVPGQSAGGCRIEPPDHGLVVTFL